MKRSCRVARNELATVRGRFAAETQRIAVAIQAELEAARSEEEQLKVQVDRASSVSGNASQYEAELKQLVSDGRTAVALPGQMWATFTFACRGEVMDINPATTSEILAFLDRHRCAQGRDASAAHAAVH